MYILNNSFKHAHLLPLFYHKVKYLELVLYVIYNFPPVIFGL